jgi:hypothetical protein
MPSWPARAARLTALGACALAGGCYTYRAVPVEQVAVGAPVRLRITPTEAARVGALLGREERVLDGQLLAKEPDDGLLVAIGSTAGGDATGVGPLHQRVTIPRAGLVELEVRRLDKVKTAGVIAAAGVAVAAAAVAAFGALNPPSGPGKGGTDRTVIPPSIRLPIVVVPVRVAP